MLRKFEDVALTLRSSYGRKILGEHLNLIYLLSFNELRRQSPWVQEFGLHIIERARIQGGRDRGPACPRRKERHTGSLQPCEALSLEPRRGTTSAFTSSRHTTHRAAQPAHSVKVPPVPSTPEPAVLPCREWMGSAAAFLADCQRDLETSPEALLAVCGRFLTPYTAQRTGIGWNHVDRYVLRKS